MRISGIGQRLAASFTVVVLLLLAVYSVNLYAQHQVDDISAEQEQCERWAEMLVERQVDHLVWLEHLTETFLGKQDHVEGVQTDPRACGLGQWLYGPDAELMSSVHEETGELVHAMEAPHQRLHASAIKISDVLQAGGGTEQALDDALVVYNEETKPALTAVQHAMHELSEHLTEDAEENRLLAEAARSRAFWIGTVFAAASVVVAIVLALTITRSILKPLVALQALFTRVGEGDLRSASVRCSRDEIGRVTAAFGDLINTLREIFGRVSTATEDVASAAREIAASSDQTARGMRDQASQTDQMSAAIEEMSVAISEVASQASDTRSLSQKSGDTARSGVDAVGKTVEGMGAIAHSVEDTHGVIKELGRRADEIGRVIDVITDIADQTNLLALNAAIEAARAGEHGRGFAVVADEVRKLAERTTEATKEVAGSIEAIQRQTEQAVSHMSEGSEKVEGGVSLAKDAGKRLDEIVARSSEVIQAVDSIAAASEEQSATVGQISQNMSSIAQSSGQTTAAAAQSAEAATALNRRSEELREIIGRFRLDETCSD